MKQPELTQTDVVRHWLRVAREDLESMNIGFSCLVEKLGIINAERFIALIKQDDFDYTVWQSEYFDKMKPGQVFEEAVEYDKKNPYQGNAVVI